MRCSMLGGMTRMAAMAAVTTATTIGVMTTMIASLPLVLASVEGAATAVAKEKSSRVHTLDLHHHPIHHSSHRQAASSRFYTYADKNRKKKPKANAKRRSLRSGHDDTSIDERKKRETSDSILKRASKEGGKIFDDLFSSIASRMLPRREKGQQGDDGGGDDPESKALRLLRFDENWGIFVGWVENALSDSEFLLKIAIGTPQQEFLTSLDTASPLLWIYSEDCCFSGNHSFFRPELSSTFVNRSLDSQGLPVAAEAGKATQTYKIKYGVDDSTSIETRLGFDTVDLMPHTDGRQRVGKGGGKDLGSNCVGNQTIGLVTRMANAKRGQGRDLRQMEGLLGLSPGNGTAMPGKLLTPIEEMIQADLLEEPIFTVSFVKAILGSDEGAQGGKLILGGLDMERMLGKVTWVESTSTVFWGFQFDKGDIRYGRQDVWPDDAPTRLIIDTGSSGIYLPSKAAKAVNDRIAGSRFDNETSLWLLPCQTGQEGYEKKLAKSDRARYFSIKIGVKRFGIPVEDLVLFPHNPVSSSSDKEELQEKRGEEPQQEQQQLQKQDMCNSAIQGGSEQFAVLGNTFIKNHAVSFKYGGKDLANRQIGFANRKDTGIVLHL